MARSLFDLASAPKLPDGSFDHAASGTRFTIRNTPSGLVQTSQSKGETSEHTVAFVVGSGNHAFGFLVLKGDHIFQSPLSYYSKRQAWDVAPGYENDPHPDFSRPLTLECLLCHADRPLPIPHTLNRYQPGVFSSLAISCDRCHGPTEAHLKKPLPGSIINPAKLSAAARDSVCEQCHLKGEARIPNPGKALSDFRPGMRSEDVYTTFVDTRPDGKEFKVVSHVEQLARSMCARQSAGKLWCGTCHNPHDKPTDAKAAGYYRARCLSCHAATLEAAHATPDRDCISCHMPKRPATDGGHTVFTDHRIVRKPIEDQTLSASASITAWRQPAEVSLQRRNLALAFAELGMMNHSALAVQRGYQMLQLLQNEFPDDSELLTQLGKTALVEHQTLQAFDLFNSLLKLEPDSADIQTNFAACLLRLNRQAEAREYLEKAITLDPLFRPAIGLLERLYTQAGDTAKAQELLARYRLGMGISVKAQQQ